MKDRNVKEMGWGNENNAESGKTRGWRKFDGLPPGLASSVHFLSSIPSGVTSVYRSVFRRDGLCFL